MLVWGSEVATFAFHSIEAPFIFILEKSRGVTHINTHLLVSMCFPSHEGGRGYRCDEPLGFAPRPSSSEDDGLWTGGRASRDFPCAVLNLSLC